MVTIYLAPGSSIGRHCRRSTPRKTQRRTMLPSGSSGQPGDEPDTRVPSIRPCSRWGLAAAASPQRPGALTARLQPYRRISQRRRILWRGVSGRNARRRYVSVPLSVPGSRPKAAAKAWALPSTLSGGARTFLPGRDCSPPRRSPGLPRLSHHQSSTGLSKGQVADEPVSHR